jgi:1,4-alpha-glucan branching enzyme
MIRLITIATGGQAYLNFIGNEFGHPDWVDFPREGNNWSFQHARRQWSLLQNPDLKYRFLALFDREMLALVTKYRLFDQVFANQLNMDEQNQTIVFERQGLIFVFNFHVSNAVPDYEFAVPHPGDYRILLNTDRVDLGGHGRISEDQVYTTRFDAANETHHLMIYNTNRTAQVFERAIQP